MLFVETEQLCALTDTLLYVLDLWCARNSNRSLLTAR